MLCFFMIFRVFVLSFALYHSLLTEFVGYSNLYLDGVFISFFKCYQIVERMRFVFNTATIIIIFDLFHSISILLYHWIHSIDAAEKVFGICGIE